MESFQDFVKAVTDLPEDGLVLILACEYHCIRVQLPWIAGAFFEAKVSFKKIASGLYLESGQRVVFMVDDRDTKYKLQGFRPALTLTCGDIDRLV